MNTLKWAERELRLSILPLNFSHALPQPLVFHELDSFNQIESLTRLRVQKLSEKFLCSIGEWLEIFGNLKDGEKLKKMHSLSSKGWPINGSMIHWFLRYVLCEFSFLLSQLMLNKILLWYILVVNGQLSIL